MKKILFVCLGFLFSASLAAQMPERNAENLKKYKEICRQHIYKNMKGMYRQPVGALKYPFLVPGSGQYANQLWDWDSWLSDIALRQIIVEHGTDADRKELSLTRKAVSSTSSIMVAVTDGFPSASSTTRKSAGSYYRKSTPGRRTCTSPCWRSMPPS